MTRREFITLVGGGAAAAWPLAARAQQTAKVHRVGFLWDGPNVFPDALEAFRLRLRDLGYVEGRNLVMEYRWAEGKPERMRELAEELVRLKVDVIVAPSSIYTEAARRATSTIPITSRLHGDPGFAVARRCAAGCIRATALFRMRPGSKPLLIVNGGNAHEDCSSSQRFHQARRPARRGSDAAVFRPGIQRRRADGGKGGAAARPLRGLLYFRAKAVQLARQQDDRGLDRSQRGGVEFQFPGRSGRVAEYRQRGAGHHQLRLARIRHAGRTVAARRCPGCARASRRRSR